jgi:crotonobetainyl-CoA:carnitine CoA-transferase CaiB-like acyl-CoA transferase
MSGPLEGLRVLDASQMLAGPLCGMRLGDLGADVLKIEPPVVGEWTRTHGFADAEVGGHTTAFLGLNRNKRSVALDLKNPAAREVFLELVTRSDVFLQNWRPGTAERLGVGYDDLKAVNPRLVYCSISGYGDTGPYVTRPGQDLIVQGYSGSMFSVGKTSDPPLPGALWAVDAMTAYHAALAILAAIVARERLGTGQKVSLNMLSVVMDAQSQELVTYLNCGILPERPTVSSAHAWVTAPYGVYKTADAWITLAQSPIHVLGEAVGSERLAEMTDWSDGIHRREEVVEILTEVMKTRTTTEWIQILDTHRLWAGPIYTYADLENDPHVQETAMITSVEHPELGPLRMPDVPVKLSETPASVRTAPPLLGEHTIQVLKEILELPDARISELAQAGAFGPVEEPQPA